MDPTIVIAAVIPSGPFGTALEPAALFAAWGAVVLAVLASLTAALGREGRAADGPHGPEDRPAAA